MSVVIIFIDVIAFCYFTLLILTQWMFNGTHAALMATGYNKALAMFGEKGGNVALTNDFLISVRNQSRRRLGNEELSSNF